MKKYLMIIINILFWQCLSYGFELHTGWFNEYETPYIETAFHFSFNGHEQLYPMNRSQNVEGKNPAGYIFYNYNFGEVYANVNAETPERESMFLFKQFKKSTEEDDITKIYIQRYGDENIPFFIFNVEENEYIFAGIKDSTRCGDNKSQLHLIYLTGTDKYEWYKTKRDLEKFHEYIKGKWVANKYYTLHLEKKVSMIDSLSENRTLNWPEEKEAEITIDFFSNTEMKWIEDKLLYYDYELEKHSGNEDINIKTFKNDSEDVIGIIPINENSFLLYQSEWIGYKKAVVYKIINFIRVE